MSCHVCLGKLEEKLTTYTVDIDGRVYIIRDVPAHVCSQCGEISYSNEVAKQIERMISAMKNGVSEVSMTTYKAA